MNRPTVNSIVRDIELDSATANMPCCTFGDSLACFTIINMVVVTTANRGSLINMITVLRYMPLNIGYMIITYTTVLMNKLTRIN